MILSNQGVKPPDLRLKRKAKEKRDRLSRSSETRKKRVNYNLNPVKSCPVKANHLTILRKQLGDKIDEVSNSEVEVGREPNKKERLIASFAQLNQEARDLFTNADDLMARPEVIKNESKATKRARQNKDNNDKLAISKQLNDLHSDVTSRISQLTTSTADDKAAIKGELDQLFALRKRLNDRMTRVTNSQITIK